MKNPKPLSEQLQDAYRERNQVANSLAEAYINFDKERQDKYSKKYEEAKKRVQDIETLIEELEI